MKTNTNTAAAAKVAAAANTNKTNATAKTAKTAKTTTDAAAKVADTTAAKVAKYDTATATKIAAELVAEFKTVSGVKANAAALIERHGGDNYRAVVAIVKGIRNEQLKRDADAVAASVFSYSGVLSAVFAELRQRDEFRRTATAAVREYNGDTTAAALRIVADYYTAVDANGAPLTKVDYLSANGREIYTVFELRTLTKTAAVGILSKSFENMTKAAAAAVRGDRDDRTATRDNVRATGIVLAVYAAAKDDTGRVVRGGRLDTSKDARTAKAAAAVVGVKIPDGLKTVREYNAAATASE